MGAYRLSRKAAADVEGRRTDRIALGVRRHECQSHVVFYVLDESGVNIARVLHARMDAPRQYVEESAGDWQK